MSKLKAYIKQMRIKGWLKNVFVFAPIVFSLELFEWRKTLSVVLLALAFCLVSSAIYVLNDICDAPKDRLHEVKKHRPIASGLITIPSAWIMFSILIVTGLVLFAYVNLKSLIFAVIYIIINVLYSIWLKHKVIIDCFCIAAGFVIRVLVGGTVVSQGVSEWMFLTIISLSLFMAFGKRKGELANYGNGATREALGGYDMAFLNGSVFLCAALTLVFYSLWSISQNTRLIYTVPIVLFIMSRYLLQVFKGRSDADPTMLILSDKVLLVACGVYGVVMIVLLYFF